MSGTWCKSLTVALCLNICSANYDYAFTPDKKLLEKALQQGIAQARAGNNSQAASCWRQAIEIAKKLRKPALSVYQLRKEYAGNLWGSRAERVAELKPAVNELLKQTDVGAEAKIAALRDLILEMSMIWTDCRCPTRRNTDAEEIKKAQGLLAEAAALATCKKFTLSLDRLVEAQWPVEHSTDKLKQRYHNLKQKCFEGLAASQTKEQFVKTMRHQWDMFRQEDDCAFFDRALVSCGIDPKSPTVRIKLGDGLLTEGDIAGAFAEYIYAGFLGSKIGEEMAHCCVSGARYGDYPTDQVPVGFLGINRDACLFAEKLIQLDEQTHGKKIAKYWRDTVILGDCYLVNQRFKDATLVYNRLLPISEAIESDDLYVRLGAANLLQGKEQEAIDYFQQSVGSWFFPKTICPKIIEVIGTFDPGLAYWQAIILLRKHNRQSDANLLVQKMIVQRNMYFDQKDRT